MNILSQSSTGTKNDKMDIDEEDEEYSSLMTEEEIAQMKRNKNGAG
jgi:hypothetical protein